MADEKKKKESYVLLVDKFQDASGVDHEKGDVVKLDEAEAKRFKGSSSIAKEGSVEARIAKGELRDDVIDHVSSESDIKSKLETLKAQLKEVEDNKKELKDAGHDVQEKSAEQIEGERQMKVGSDKAAYENAKKKGDRS